MVADDKYERDLIKRGFKYIGSVDESGLGSFVGNLYSAVVIFEPNVDYRRLMPGLNDSKQKTSKQREILYEQVKGCALDYAIGTADKYEIDKLNVYWAKWVAIRRAIKKLKITPDYILMDGNKKIPEIDIPQSAIVKGDGKCFSIAAASILAKVERDEYMRELAKLVHKDYGWESNKGYYCKGQIEAIRKYGATKFHRNKYVEKFLIK
jgi:ribonuclease HII